MSVSRLHESVTKDLYVRVTCHHRTKISNPTFSLIWNRRLASRYPRTVRKDDGKNRNDSREYQNLTCREIHSKGTRWIDSYFVAYRISFFMSYLIPNRRFWFAHVRLRKNLKELERYLFVGTSHNANIRSQAAVSAHKRTGNGNI
jgi:hypothetical protein